MTKATSNPNSTLRYKHHIIQIGVEEDMLNIFS